MTLERRAPRARGVYVKRFAFEIISQVLILMTPSSARELRDLAVVLARDVRRALKMERLLAMAAENSLAALERDGATASARVKDWWAPATAASPTSAYGRLIEACRLAVEEAYTTESDVIGAYAEAAGQPGEGMRFFRLFVRAAAKKRLLPPWWDPEHTRGCEALARDRNGDFYILHAVEVSDVRKTWGHATTNMLRALGKAVYDAVCDSDDASEGSEGSSDEDGYDHLGVPAPAGKASAQKASAPQQGGGRECSGCGQSLDASCYSSNQWKKGGVKRRCKACIERAAEAPGGPGIAPPAGKAAASEHANVGKGKAAAKPAAAASRASVAGLPSHRASGTTADGFSTCALVDHLLSFDAAATADASLGVLAEHYVPAVGGSLGVPPAKVKRAQQALKRASDAGAPNGQYLFGKLLADTKVVVVRPTS